MNIQLPNPKEYDGVVLNGWTVGAAGGPETLSGAIIVKCAYDISPVPNAPGAMVRSSNRARFAISFEDAGIKTIDNKGTADTKDDVVTDFAYERDSDIALQKAQVDIAVKGWGGLGTSGDIRIDNVNWYSRTTADGDLKGDMTTNLFGWHPRDEDNRNPDVAESFKPKFPPLPVDTLPPEYGPVFNNFHRRSTGIGPTAAGSAAALPSGKVVAINKTNASGSESLTFRLPDMALKARLRAWCGDCPDKPERWCIKGTIALSPDTLIVDPVANQAEILWRGSFNWNGPDGKPVEWRLAQVMEGAV